MFKRSLAALVVTGAMVASTGVYAEGGGKAMAIADLGQSSFPTAFAFCLGGPCHG